eukprot:m.44615 g.44615  ORF g.44615 m.44615 type:complete len:552 (+) comp10842_c0_seq1:35-1690(+)
MEQEQFEMDETEPMLASRRQHWNTARVRWVVVGLAVVMVVGLIGVGVVAQQARAEASKSRFLGRSYLCDLTMPALAELPPHHYTQIKQRVASSLEHYFPQNLTLVAFLRGLSSEQHVFSDAEQQFWQESNFRYLSGGYERAGEAWLLCGFARETLQNPFTVNCSVYATQPTVQDAIWNGGALTLQELRQLYQLPIHWRPAFTAQVEWLLGNLSAIAPVGQVLTLPDTSQLNSTPPEPLAMLDRNATVLRDVLGLARSIKTETELYLMEVATNVSVSAHKQILRTATDSLFEYEVEGAFVAKHLGCGVKQQAYLPIMGSGMNAGTLHYNHNLNPLAGNWLLVDAGGNFQGYGTDITRTWAVSGQFSELQQRLYNVVLTAEHVGIQHYRPGYTWRNATDAVDRSLVEGLVQLGLIRNVSISDLLKSKVLNVFMPHSLGHHIGLDVHDYAPGGLGKCRPSEDPDEGTVCPGQFEVNMAITCEPGLYFIPQLIQDSLDNPDLAKYMVQPEIQRYIDESIGGVRIEDVVVVQQAGPLVLSGALPRTVADLTAHIQP